MRLPFTPYGTAPLLAFSLPLAGLSLLLARLAPGLWWLAPLPLLLFVLSFFRDPERSGPGGEEALLAPADGLVADIVELDDPTLGSRGTRIGIFLSVFNVHVNRSPCSARVLAVERREGGFLDARDPRAVEQNQAAALLLERPDGRRLAVRQITGLIARRIVCPVAVGDQLGRGQRYGMIRFGSRTELVIPTEALDRLCIAVGDTVRGGATVLATLRPTAQGAQAEHAAVAPGSHA